MAFSQNMLPFILDTWWMQLLLLCLSSHFPALIIICAVPLLIHSHIVCSFKCSHCFDERKIRNCTVPCSHSSFLLHKQFSVQALLPLKFLLWIFMRYPKCAECKYKSTVRSAKVNEDSPLVSCWVCCWMHCSNAWRLCSQGSPSTVRQGMHHMWTEKCRMLVSSQTKAEKRVVVRWLNNNKKN